MMCECVFNRMYAFNLAVHCPFRPLVETPARRARACDRVTATYSHWSHHTNSCAWVPPSC